MIHRYKDYVYIHNYGKGKLYKGNHLLFIGNAWSDILEFIHKTNNSQEVKDMFAKYFVQDKKTKPT